MASVCSVAMASRVCPARWCYNSSGIHAGHWGRVAICCIMREPPWDGFSMSFERFQWFSLQKGAHVQDNSRVSQRYQALIYQVDFVGRGLEVCEYVWSVVVLGLIHRIQRGLPAYISWHQLTGSEFPFDSRIRSFARGTPWHTCRPLWCLILEVPSNLAHQISKAGRLFIEIQWALGRYCEKLCFAMTFRQQDELWWIIVDCE